MKIVQVPLAPHKKVRMLLAALADIRLRKHKYLSPLDETVRNSRGGRVWTEREHDIAFSLQLKGKTNADIARRLKRSVHAIDRAVGPECGERGRYAITDRPHHLKTSNRGNAKHNRAPDEATQTDPRTTAAA